jgi:tetraacyldisaccharide 4'-kinase
MQPLGNSFFPRMLSVVYGCVILARNFLYDHIPAMSHDAGRPVISIGGINAGGTGKTPMALLVGTFLKNNGINVIFLSRGFRRKTRKTVICEPQALADWENVGDEPALLHANIPGSWLGIGASRLKTIRKMLPALSKRSAFVMDDGFQHRRVRRNVDILCVPPDVLDDHVMPAGTLREPLNALRRAHCICIIGARDQAALCEKTREKIDTRYKPSLVVVLHQVFAGWVHLKTGRVRKELPVKSPLLVCGIARPERFADLVRSMGVHPAKEVLREDHHEFTAREIQRLYRGTFDGILTTEKDAHRLLTLNLVNCPDIWYLKIDLHFSDQTLKNVFFSRVIGSMSL